MNKETPHVFKTVTIDYWDRLFNHFIRFWLALTSNAVGIVVSMFSFPPASVVFVLILIILIIRGFYWSKISIIHLTIDAGRVKIEYFDKMEFYTKESSMDDVVVKLTPLHVQDYVYKMKIKFNDFTVTQYPDNYWTTERMRNLENQLKK